LNDQAAVMALINPCPLEARHFGAVNSGRDKFLFGDYFTGKLK
jgi:hypothetical protein